MNTGNELKAGFVYTFEAYEHPARDGEGRVIDLGPLSRRSVRTNLVPDGGLHSLVTTWLGGAQQVPTWYLGLFSGNYTPQPGDTMATFPALAGEVTAYTNSTRHAVTFDNAVAGVILNTNHPVLVEFTSAVNVQGCFLTSSPAKGSTVGVLASVVPEPTPFQMRAGGILRVMTGLEVTRPTVTP